MILATNLVSTTPDAPSFAVTVLGMKQTIGPLKTVLADTGFASGPAVEAPQAEKIEPLVAIGSTQPHRPYDFRPPPKPKAARRITEPWRIAMKADLSFNECSVVFGDVKITAALLDRLTHHRYILETGNDSFRSKSSSTQKSSKQKDKAVP